MNDTAVKFMVISQKHLFLPVKRHDAFSGKTIHPHPGKRPHRGVSPADRLNPDQAALPVAIGRPTVHCNRPCPSRNEVRPFRPVVTVRTMRPCASRYVTTSAAHRPVQRPITANGNQCFLMFPVNLLKTSKRNRSMR